MRYKIMTPLAGVTGTHAGVNFTGGTTVIDDEVAEQAAALRYFRQAGYGVVEVDEKGEPVIDQDAAEAGDDRTPVIDHAADAGPMPGRNASREEWRAYAVRRGMPEEEANKLSRDELVARYIKTKEAGQ